MRIYGNPLVVLIAGGISLLSTRVVAQNVIVFGEETQAQADQVINIGNSPIIGGIVVVCEHGVNPNPNGGPNAFPIFNIGLGGNPGNNFGISDILAFIPAINPGGGNELFGELASDQDPPLDPTSFADNNGITLNGAPYVFVNPLSVGVTEVWGQSGTVEYAPGVGEPGYFLDANGQPPVYEIATDNSGNGSSNIPPQTPPDTFLAGGPFVIQEGSVPTVPEPGSTLMLSSGALVGCMILARRKKVRQIK